MNKFTDADGTGKCNILLPLVLTENQFLSVRFAIFFFRSDKIFQYIDSLAPNLSKS